MAKHATRNRHLSEADDRFVEALLEEHARLGSGDDVALLALVRARTEEHPESGRNASAQSFGMRHWLQLAAVVTLIGLILTLAFRHFAPGHTSGKEGNGVVASPADSPAAQGDQETAYTIRMKNGTAAPHSDPQLPAIDDLGLPLVHRESVSVSPLFVTASPWQSPLTRPLSTLAMSNTASEEDSLALDQIQSLLEKGEPLPAGSVTFSGLLRQLPLTIPQEDSERIQLASATCPWNSDHRLVHVGVNPGADGKTTEQASGSFRPQGPAELAVDATFPVFHTHRADDNLSMATASADRDALFERIIAQQISAQQSELTIEFNPAQVSHYRLLGHATQKDGTLTALYELKATDHPAPFADAQPNLKYQPNAGSEDLLSAHLDGQDTSIDRNQTSDWQQASSNLQVAAAAALFASMVENGEAPTREQVDALKAIPPIQATSSPELEKFRALIFLWGESVVANTNH